MKTWGVRVQEENMDVAFGPGSFITRPTSSMMASMSWLEALAIIIWERERNDEQGTYFSSEE